MADQDELVARIREAGRALAGRRAAVVAGAPWPLSDRIGHEPEASWGPPEVLAHLAEMVPFWHGEIERVLAGRPEPVPFGRLATNELRIGIVERDRSLPPAELFDRTAAALDRLAARLAGLSPAEAARRGQHPVWGEETVPEIAARVIARHLEEHVEQLDASLAAGRG